jgi:ABC-type branched-subunit amino acid transport system ATPase component
VSLLRVQDLTKRFGGLVAVNDVSFDVEEGGVRREVQHPGALW